MQAVQWPYASLRSNVQQVQYANEHIQLYNVN